VLEHTFDHVEFISLHTYLNDYAGDTPAFLASPDWMDRFIEEVVAITDAVAEERGSAKRIQLSFDEWNVWYRTRRGDDRKEPGWPIAPHILEEVYTMKDALAFGGMCISLLNHADRVKCACLAQLVNAIAPILTETGGPAWRQTTFWPFADFANLGRGTVLKARVESPAYDCIYADPRGATMLEFPMSGVPYLKAAAVHSAEDRMLTLFLLNRSLDDSLSVSVEASGFVTLAPAAATTLRNDNLEAANTKDATPVLPAPLDGIAATDGGLRLTLPAASWNVVRLKAS
jgi:alpha-L-arabinofuranosidase